MLAPFPVVLLRPTKGGVNDLAQQLVVRPKKTLEIRRRLLTSTLHV